MYLVKRTLRFVNGALKSYGPSSIKKRLWDKEYSSEKWDFAENSTSDCVYAYLERYAANGSILDLGCGSGNTANELAASACQSYVGVDISEKALRKASKRSEQNGRAQKNRFAQGDFLSYTPSQKFDVILFRESMYHVPLGKIKTMLERYSQYLQDGGVFIVRMNTSHSLLGRTKAMVDVIEAEFDVAEKRQYGESGPTVLVFRPRLHVTEKLDRNFENQTSRLTT
jgi:2-polyprenyl-3-methyl-5-hydroxy-6-metoxy-1,4-benzoquinol methylase